MHIWHEIKFIHNTWAMLDFGCLSISRKTDLFLSSGLNWSGDLLQNPCILMPTKFVLIVFCFCLVLFILFFAGMWWRQSVWCHFEYRTGPLAASYYVCVCMLCQCLSLENYDMHLCVYIYCYVCACQCVLECVSFYWAIQAGLLTPLIVLPGIA